MFETLVKCFASLVLAAWIEIGQTPLNIACMQAQAQAVERRAFDQGHGLK
jgi:hypothetical protein